VVLMDGAKGSVTSDAIGGTVAAGDLLFATP
jgi:PTS system glucose-specific IIA component